MEFEISTTEWWRDDPQCAMVPHAGRASVRPLLPHKTKQNNFILFQLDRSINRLSFTSWDFSLKHKSWVKWFHFFPSLCSEIEAALRSDRESVEVKMELKLLMIKNINCQHHHHRLTDACLSVSLIFSSVTSPSLIFAAYQSTPVANSLWALLPIIIIIGLILRTYLIFVIYFTLTLYETSKIFTQKGIKLQQNCPK